MIVKVIIKNNSWLCLRTSAAGGEIFNHCVSDELLPEGQITRLIRQMLEGIHLLHQNSLVHLDLKVRYMVAFNTIIEHILSLKG